VVGDEDVLVRVHAAGVDPSVWHLMEGTPYLVRAMGFGLRAPKVRVRGWDAAGRVATVGRSVTRLRPGDEVFGACEGSFAEYARAPADQLAPKPVNLSYEEAAVVPVSACTALHALREKGEVRSGQRVLVIGAAGGVGSFAVQLAKAFGAEVTGVCSPRKLDLVRSIGADDVIDYTREDFADGRRRYDVVLDMAGRRSLRDLRRALAPAGTLVMIGGEGGGRWLGGAQRSMLWGPALSLVGRQRLRGLFSTERTEDLLALKDLIEAGEITPALDRTYALSEVPEAIRYVRDGQARGKVAITVRPAIP
jgi:NADPH:quinone reductase-like Zn-dependent oxidoreductase